MSSCDAETLEVGLESPSPIPSSNATDTQETLIAQLQILNLEENPEPKSDEIDILKLEENPEEKSDGGDQDFAAIKENRNPEEKPKETAVDGWGSDQEPSGEVKVDGWGSDQEPSGEVKVDGWGWDQEPVKVDGWGWDQDFTESGGNEKLEKDLWWSSAEKVEAWGWDQETGGNEESVKSEKGSEKGQRKKSPFPVRPNEPDCAYYVRMGTCRYGLNCKFNHPFNKMRSKVKFRRSPESGQAVELNENGMLSEMAGQTEREKAYKENKMGTLSESNGQMDCKYYSMPGGCKYGSACKYNHREKTEVSDKLNFLGLPMRPGEKECTYYMRTGSCKYSTNCRFHHPDPIAVGGQDTSPGYKNGGSPLPHAPPAQLPMPSWPVQRTPNEPVPFLDTPTPYVTGFFLPPQGLHPNSEWNGYQAPVNPLFPAEMNMPHPQSAATMKDTMRKGNGSAPNKASDVEYPERPGQPECQFFMKTGTCKFTSACKFHHPKSRIPKPSGVNISPVGLPLRPDQPVCTHYRRHGICKFGQSCRYNHPMDCNPSVSPAAVAESSQKVFPETGFESQEVKTEGSTNPVQDSEW